MAGFDYREELVIELANRILKQAAEMKMTTGEMMAATGYVNAAARDMIDAQPVTAGKAALVGRD